MRVNAISSFNYLISRTSPPKRFSSAKALDIIHTFGEVNVNSVYIAGSSRPCLPLMARMDNHHHETENEFDFFHQQQFCGTHPMLTMRNEWQTRTTPVFFQMVSNDVLPSGRWSVRVVDGGEKNEIY